ncbi:MAG: cobyric acid synthase [Gammaproteobacteria bacterium]|nr:cobyric acid synthase [Gammaproteobacteria bacterium]
MTKENNKIKGALMIQGTTSDAGKSIFVTGLCRLLQRKGISVAPFKPQNMALNSAVTSCGGEIGRAQALQAIACGLELRTDFNPVLLKPSSDKQSQVIIQGKAVEQLDANTFGNIKTLAFDKVLESYHRLKNEFDVVLIEGAGSPAEINLRKNDIANMGFAEAVDCPVVLISDINRGGVFAHLTGTVNLLSESEQERINGFVINQFRGDLGLLQPGVDWLENYSNKPVLGVLPHLKNLKLDAEDAIDPNIYTQAASINIKIPVLQRISNHTDFEPLKWYPDVNMQFIGADESLENTDLIIIPGSKNVREDLLYLQQQGWDKQIYKHLRYGGKLIGICGGYQMLGNYIHDLNGIEGEQGSSKALSLLDFETSLASDKQLKQVKGHFNIAGKHGKLQGYEIHCGISTGSALDNHFAELVDQENNISLDGAISNDNQIIGTYLHGLFESKDSLETILNWVSGKNCEAKNWAEIREAELERLADAFEEYLDIEKIFSIIK